MPSQPIIQEQAEQLDNTSRKNNNRKLVLQACALLGVIVIILIISIIISNVSSTDDSNGDAQYDGVSDSVLDDVAPYVYLKNPAYLQAYVGDTVINHIRQTFQDIILSESELTSAPSTNAEDPDYPPSAYAITIDNTSLIPDVYFPLSTYTFVINISDGRAYQAYLATNDDMYYGLILHRITPATDNPPDMIINFLIPESTSTYNRDSVVNNIKSWANSIGFSEFYLTTTNTF